MIKRGTVCARKRETRRHFTDHTLEIGSTDGVGYGPPCRDWSTAGRAVRPRRRSGTAKPIPNRRDTTSSFLVPRARRVHRPPNRVSLFYYFVFHFLEITIVSHTSTDLRFQFRCARDFHRRFSHVKIRSPRFECFFFSGCDFRGIAVFLSDDAAVSAARSSKRALPVSAE